MAQVVNEVNRFRNPAFKPPTIKQPKASPAMVALADAAYSQPSDLPANPAPPAGGGVNMTVPPGGNGPLIPDSGGANVPAPFGDQAFSEDQGNVLAKALGIPSLAWYMSQYAPQGYYGGGNAHFQNVWKNNDTAKAIQALLPQFATGLYSYLSGGIG